jgi:hypothetical protein
MERWRWIKIMNRPGQLVVLDEPEWKERRDRHRDRLAGIVQQHLERRRRGVRHPVHDFLFEYYFFSPAKLMQWSPGVGVVLTGEDATELMLEPEYARWGDGVALDPARFPRGRVEGARWIRDLLRATLNRAPQLACHGLHEWAMVYGSEARRHAGTSLRLTGGEIDAVVKSLPVCCTHFDAYRFFTSAALPLNPVSLTRSRQVEFEQPGCLHANMDLYKWAYKFQPWIGSELVGDAFLLAWDIRQLDMQASPYDVRELGLDPVRIETDSGRTEYRRRQQEFVPRAQEIRRRLAEAYDRMLDWATETRMEAGERR